MVRKCVVFRDSHLTCPANGGQVTRPLCNNHSLHSTGEPVQRQSQNSQDKHASWVANFMMMAASRISNVPKWRKRRTHLTCHVPWAEGGTKQKGSPIPRPASEGPAQVHYLWSPDDPGCTPRAITQRRRTVRSASSAGHGSGSRFGRSPRATCLASAGVKRRPNAHASSFLPRRFMRRLVLPKSAPRPGKTRLLAKGPIRRCVWPCFSVEHV
jgi:hypothetical protein